MTTPLSFCVIRRYSVNAVPLYDNYTYHYQVQSSGDTVRLLLALAKQAAAPTTHDSTCYGTARTSPRSYFPHHTAAISAVIAYADAQRRGIPCSLLVSETTGALSRDTVRLLLALAKQATAPTTRDSTCYGTARTSPRSYFPHHTAAISAAIALADATSVMQAAAALSFRLSLGLAP